MSYIGANPIYYNKPVFRFRRPMGTKKNLFGNFIDEDTLDPSEDAIKVFLRLKPTITDSDVIQVLDSKNVLFKMPAEFMQARNKLNLPDQYKYCFSHIFQPQTTQSEIYTGCVAPLIKDVFNGQHCLLFTYGTTNAGKTFTVLGTGDHPGIIPRTLTTVFKSITGKEYGNPRIMPTMFNSAIEINENTLHEEFKFKESIMTWNHNKSQPDSKLYKTQSTVRSSIEEIFGESVFKEMQKRLTNDTSIIEYEAEPEDRFSVWVSFAEIYNEAIYDLLQPMMLNSKRKQLKLAQDNNKNYYIKGLKQVFVQSEEEAYKVLMFGKTNLQVAATGMNSRSSRSHCIFTIKLIKTPNVEHPERVVVSSFSICDLAGAERQKKTLNVGLRLKESQNINCSLHVLSRCFSIIRDNQQNTEQKMIPFRDSKLTQLFRHALTGKESVTMIVNVNSDHHLCEETQHVLKASAIAKHIVVQPRKAKRPQLDIRKSRFSQIIIKHDRSTLIRWDSCTRPKAPGPPLTEAAEDSSKSGIEQKQDQCENLLALVEDLKEKLKEEKMKHLETKRTWRQREDDIREEMREELTKILEEAKQQNVVDNKRAHDVTKDTENDNERKLLPPVNKKPKKLKEATEEIIEHSFELKDLQEEVRMQQQQIDGLTDLVNMLRDEKKEQRMELTLHKFNLGQKEREIENLKKKIEMFAEESTLHEKYLAFEKEMEEKLRIREELLNEAREDMLAEMRAKDDMEEEMSKLEKELTEKHEEVMTLQSKIEELKEEISDNEDYVDLLEARIRNMETTHEEEMKSFKTKCCVLEEEVARLKQFEEHSNMQSSSQENLDQEIEKLSAKIEELLCEKVVMSEQLEKQQEDHSFFKEESSRKLHSLARVHDEEKTKISEEFIGKLSARDEQIRLLQENLVAYSQNLESIKMELQSTVTLAETYKTELETIKKDNDGEKSELEKKIIELTQRLTEKNDICLVSNELKHKCESLRQALDEKAKEIEELLTIVESSEKKNKLIEEGVNSEISTLEQSLKKEIQETTRLSSLIREKERENEKVMKELSKVKTIVAELKTSLKNREHDLECCQSKMMGYEQMLPTLQSEFEVLRKELAEYKKKCEDQVETIINMEKELNSFQVNQKEIIGKYEDQLKKTKEENDSLKKEVARVTTTFYKSTPTPKKILEKQIEDQQKSLEDLKALLEEKEANCHKLLQENETLSKMLIQVKATVTEEANKENENHLNDDKYHSKGTKLRLRENRLNPESEMRCRALSCEEKSEHMSELDLKKSKSATKTRPRRTTRATACPEIVITTDCDINNVSEDKPDEKLKNPKKQTRKKLWDATLNDGSQLEDIEVDLNIAQDSPGTLYKRTLRNRNK